MAVGGLNTYNKEFNEAFLRKFSPLLPSPLAPLRVPMIWGFEGLGLFVEAGVFRLRVSFQDLRACITKAGIRSASLCQLG